MNHEKDFSNYPAGNNSSIVRKQPHKFLQLLKGIFGLWWLLIPGVSDAQIIQDFVVTQVKGMVIKPITGWRNLSINDTVRMLYGRTVTAYRMECTGKKHPKVIQISRKKLEDGDTLSLVRKERH